MIERTGKGIKKFFSTKTNYYFYDLHPDKFGVMSFVLVYALLFLLEPFGIYRLNFHWKFVLVTLYSSVVLVLNLMVYFFFRRFLKTLRTKWGIKHDILLFLALSIVAGLMVYIISYLVFIVFYPTVFVMPEYFIIKCIYYSGCTCTIVFVFLKIIDLYNHFCIAIEQGNRNQKTEDNNITIRSNDKNAKIAIFKSKNIIFFEANRNKVLVFYLNEDIIEEHSIKKSLKEIEAQFCNSSIPFFKCHKSFIVNTTHIKEISGNSRNARVVLSKKMIIPLSQNKLDALKSAF